MFYEIQIDRKRGKPMWHGTKHPVVFDETVTVLVEADSPEAATAICEKWTEEGVTDEVEWTELNSDDFSFTEYEIGEPTISTQHDDYPLINPA